MKHTLTMFIALLLAALATPAFADLTQAVTSAEAKLSLWYPKAATNWNEALPLGNGRLGAMVFGGAEQERIQLNEGTLWAGGPYDPNNTNALAALPEARRLIFDGDYEAAHKLIGEKMMAVPLKQMPYQMLGDLFLAFPANAAIENYRRDLNLDSAVASVSYTANGVHFRREVFASAVDQVIVVRLTADQPGRISFTAALRTPQKATVTAEAGNSLVIDGANREARGIRGALKFQARLQVLAQGGTTTTNAHEVVVANADSTTLLIAAATSYKNYRDVGGDPAGITKRQLAAAAQKKPDALLAAHLADYRKLFRRVELNLGETDAMKLPTDQRIAQFTSGNDPQLAALYCQFARYLLISCSRPGGQPATLQGLWNDSLTPPWDSKYTININTEMNYWPAEPGNLGECVEPLTQMVLELMESGARTAKIHYGARGWVTHHNTDLWRATAPIDGPTWGMWPTGGAWLCQNLWEHYQFNGDKEYLQRIYPAMKSAALFFPDTLVEEPVNRWLVTCPSLSPENPHRAGNITVCAGPSMDMQILRDLFANCIRASETLGVDEAFRREVAAARARLAPPQIGGSGQLQEWLEDWDLKVPEIHHRHVSHLYALFPSPQIDVNTTPALAAAAKKSLELRGDKATGWGTAWRINLWARLHEGDHAFGILQFLLSPKCTYPNLLDSCPPFQIDGNFGGACGIMEMLLQSQNDELQLLPALPKAWPTGSVRGLRARGNFTVDMAWKGGKVTTYRIASTEPRGVKVRINGEVKAVKAEKL